MWSSMLHNTKIVILVVVIVVVVVVVVVVHFSIDDRGHQYSARSALIILLYLKLSAENSRLSFGFGPHVTSTVGFIGWYISLTRRRLQ